MKQSRTLFMAAVAALGQAKLQVTNTPSTTCDTSVSEACRNLMAEDSESHPDFTETLALLDLAEQCVLDNGEEADCQAGVTSDVVVGGSQLCNSAGAGFYVDQEMGRLKIEPSFQLSIAVPSFFAGKMARGYYYDETPVNSTICHGGKGKEGQFSISEDGFTITAPAPGLAFYVPNTVKQLEIGFKASKVFTTADVFYTTTTEEPTTSPTTTNPSEETASHTVPAKAATPLVTNAFAGIILAAATVSLTM